MNQQQWEDLYQQCQDRLAALLQDHQDNIQPIIPHAKGAVDQKIACLKANDCGYGSALYQAFMLYELAQNGINRFMDSYQSVLDLAARAVELARANPDNQAMIDQVVDVLTRFDQLLTLMEQAFQNFQDLHIEIAEYMAIECFFVEPQVAEGGVS